MADRGSPLGNALSGVIEAVALVLAVLAAELSVGVWGERDAAGTIWPGVMVAVAQLLTATMAVMLMAVYGRGYLLWRGGVLLAGYLVGAYCLVQAFVR